jgi:hypothetical protein
MTVIVYDLQRTINHRRVWAPWLALLLVAMNVTDWSLTYMALTYHGLSEANHAVAAWISTPFGFAAKLIIPAIIGWRFATRAMDRAVYNVLASACIVYGLVIIWNFYAIYFRGA